MASARPHPPSSQRIAEARAGGHIPRPALLWLVAVVAMGGAFAAQREALSRLVIALWQEPLTAGDPERAWAALERIGRELSTRVLGALALAFASALLITWLVQGPAFASWSRRARFAPVRIDRTASVLWGLALALCTAFALARFTLLETELTAWAWTMVFASVGCLLVDVAFARARWFASLWMTRREFVDDQREQGPAPELVAARRRTRGDA